GGGDATRTYAVDRDAAIRTMDAAAKADVSRYIMVSWLGSTADHGVSEDDSFFAYADAKWAADEYLRNTELDGTILGPGALTDSERSGQSELDPSGRGAVSRADVAAVIAATLGEPLTIGRTIRFGNGTSDSSEPISVAL